MDARNKHRLIAAISARRGEMIEFVEELVAIPTENPPGRAYPACVKAIANKLRRLQLDCEIIDIPTDAKSAGRKSFTSAGSAPLQFIRSFYTSNSSPKSLRTVYFHGHYDVVPAQTPGQFKPRIQAGKLIGRGSSDMKSGLAAMIFAVHALKECGIELAGRVGLAIVPDEETGGAKGSARLLRAGLLGEDGAAMFTPEPTGGVIWNANRGAISLRVTVKGKSAHVGLQHMGTNAFEKMLDVARALRTLKKEVESRKTKFNIAPDAARRSILMLGGRSEGGTNFNLVPAEFSFTIDRRINPDENFAVEKAALLDLFEKCKRAGAALDVEVLQEGSAAGVSCDNRAARALAESVEAVTGKPAKFEMCPGLLENRFYAERGIPAFAYGPGLLTVSHGPREFVPLARIPECAAVYALAAARILARDGTR
jgi:acetylornithine deacetylase/succinyl-diaminopimelate desuccinylase family protein